MRWGRGRGNGLRTSARPPGGKSFTLAQYMDNQGEILACDLYPAKCDTMEKRAAALGHLPAHRGPGRFQALSGRPEGAA